MYNKHFDPDDKLSELRREEEERRREEEERRREEEEIRREEEERRREEEQEKNKNKNLLNIINDDLEIFMVIKKENPIGIIELENCYCKLIIIDKKKWK